MYNVQVTISQKESVLNPAAKATFEAAEKFQAATFEDFVIKRLIEFSVNAADEAEAKSLADQFTQQLLVNGAMEVYDLRIEEAN